MDSQQRIKQTNFSVGLGLGANIVLALVKSIVGIIGSSPALLADGINSSSDVVYYLVVSVFVRAANKPADDEHPYGHTQYESVGALVVGAFVITTALTIFWNAIDTLVQVLQGKSEFTGGSPLALYVALGTVLIKIALFLITARVGKITNNETVIALASDHRNDILAASAATLGIFMGRLGYLWMDPAAGGLVAFFILRTGISIVRESTAALMDTVPGKPLNDKVMGLVRAVPGVQEVDNILAHRFGQYYIINLTISVSDQISVHDGDMIASQVEKALLDSLPDLRSVHVHYHPRAQFRGEL
ncbi:MAG TPA: cation diffusion facilitator family transporter [Anaerolineaceae bacterium]|nr:cation diffusion facilitator family transporter [Anaerolineaceae bacterium]